MQEHQYRTLAALDVMQAHAIHFDEPALRRVFALGLAALVLHVEERRGKPQAGQQRAVAPAVGSACRGRQHAADGIRHNHPLQGWTAV
jgi:hypothetical protein